MMPVSDSTFVRTHAEPIVVVCDGSELGRVTSYVRQGLAGQLSAPLFLIGPNVDPCQARDEVVKAGYPVGTGVLMRTSGSTSGTGTIVPLSWYSLASSAQATHQALAGPGRWLADLPLHHIAGFQTIVRSVLANTEPINMSLTDMLTTRSVTGLTYCSVVPTQLSRILANRQLTQAAREVTLLVGGAATSSSLLNRARDNGLTLHTSYGMTETCGGCVYDGHPIGDAVISLAQSGQISLTGSMVTGAGLLTEHNGRQSRPCTYTHLTRDLGIINPEGTLSVLGRIDDAITTGGLTIMPHIVEETLAELTGYTAVVVGVADETWGQSALAFLDPRAPELSTSAEKQLREKVKTKLGTGWQPRRIRGLSVLGMTHWPLTPSGKIDRRAITSAAHIYFSGDNS